MLKQKTYRIKLVQDKLEPWQVQAKSHRDAAKKFAKQHKLSESEEIAVWTEYDYQTRDQEPRFFAVFEI